jgi:hypothetical protein
MEFSPNNNIIRLCLQGINQEEQAQPEEAGRIFLQAWNEATDDFEKYTAAFFVARHQDNIPDKLKWLGTSLQFALNINDVSVKAAFYSLYLNISKCYEDLNDSVNANRNHELAISFKDKIFDKGPFYHGTKADLKTGDLLTEGSRSNYRPEVTMNHIYFTALVNGAGLAAALAKGDGEDHVYIVEPTGSFENDPNVTDKKFPGNPTRSYRTSMPLKIVGEVKEWERLTSAEVQKWKGKIADSKGDIIN